MTSGWKFENLTDIICKRSSGGTEQVLAKKKNRKKFNVYAKHIMQQKIFYFYALKTKTRPKTKFLMKKNSYQNFWVELSY